jgi:hypothetical protein
VREFLNLDLGDSFISVASNWLHKEKFYSVNIYYLNCSLVGFLVNKK